MTMVNAVCQMPHQVNLGIASLSCVMVKHIMTDTDNSRNRPQRVMKAQEKIAPQVGQGAVKD
jgi:hypothetical protein